MAKNDKDDKETKPAIKPVEPTTKPAEPKDSEAAKKAKLEAAKKLADEANKAAAPDIIKVAKAAAKAKEEQIKEQRAAHRQAFAETGKDSKAQVEQRTASAQPVGTNDYTGVRQFVRKGGDTWHPTQIKWIPTTEATAYGTQISSTTP